MWWLIILTLHKSFIVCQIQSPQATWATDFYESTFQRCESTIHIIFNYVRAEQDHCLYNITGWRKWDSALLPRELTGSRWQAGWGSDVAAAAHSLTLSFTMEGDTTKPPPGLGAGMGRCLGRGGSHTMAWGGSRMREAAVISFAGLLPAALCCDNLFKEKKN